MEKSFLTNENRLILEKRERLRELLNDRPVAVHSLLSKCEVRALVVADDFLYFDDEDFGLSDFVDFLEASFSPYVRIGVRKAHRDDPGAVRLAGADANFTFSDASLQNVDVLFLFGAHDRSGPALQQTEVDAIKRFMDAGGGVFATGDHEDLGVAMCGQIPRVRSMRKWYWPQSAATAAGQPVAPDGGSAARHDTNRTGHDAVFTFNDQSDDVPQRIRPRYYQSGVFKRRPHPLLCGPRGKIDVLPDHPHEGECIAVHAPSEFPANADGDVTWPEVIATSDMIPGAEASGKPPVPGGSFGAISAYDGHRTNVGRVATDATWHHFININLTGTALVPASNPKSVGFLHTPEGQAHLEAIKGYFRNLAVWLAPRSLQRCIAFRKLLSQIVSSSMLLEELQGRHLETASAADLISVGRSGLAVFKVNTEICEELALDVLVPELVWPAFRDLIPRPWPDPVPDLLPLSEEVVFAALGASILGLRDALSGVKDKAYSEALEQKLMAKFETAAAVGIARAVESSRKRLRQTAAMLDRLEAACG